MAGWKTGLSMAAAVAAMLGAAHGQSLDVAPSPYFDCPYVNYFDRDCPQLWEERQQRRLQGQDGAGAAPLDRDTVRQGERSEEDQGESGNPDADETYLLFPRESLAPDAPPLFRLLLAEPTLDNARRYVRWYARRAARLQAVQALIRVAGSDLEAKAGGEKP